MTNKKEITFAVTGDSLIVTRLNHETEELKKLQSILLECDVRFTNLETSVHRYENDIFASRMSGGDWVAAKPEVLEDLKWLGFNLLGLPNNHSLDWSQTGLLRTVENVDKADIVYAGMGKNLYEASRPKYIETAHGRVAFIAFCTSFEAWHKAGEQRRDFNGRPGINGVEFTAIHRISKEQMELLKQIEEVTEVNNKNKGIKAEPGKYLFGDSVFEEGGPGTYTYANKEDLERIRSSINEAKRQADLVIVSAHTHEKKALDPTQNADFQNEISHFCIDAGANAYFGHGPHVLRGIEIYKNAPIFHSLGDFFYQCELIERAPGEFYKKFGNLGESACTADGFDYRINQGGMLGELNPKCYQSVIITFGMKEGKITSMKFLPVSLNFGTNRAVKGWPEAADAAMGQEILTDLKKLSESYGTKILIEDNVGILIM